MKINLDEEIYFGGKYVKMYPCKGIFRAYKKEYIHQDDLNKDSISIAIKYADDLSYIKEEYKDYYIPCIPETYIKFMNNNIGNNETEKTDNSFLSQPLLKFKEIHNLSPCYTAAVSGHRSAIIKDEKTSKYFRFKGCGNDEIGFNLMKGENFFTEINTRGSQYDCTCPRELYFSEKVNEVLKKINIPCGNIPVGFWKYSKNLEFLSINNNEQDNKIELPIPENKVPEIDKYCGIYVTLGDKRLKTHLLGGLEKIFDFIAQLCISSNDIDENKLNEIKKIFPQDRFNEIETYKTIILFFPPYNSDNNKYINVDDWCKNPIYSKKNYDELISCDKLLNEMKINENIKKIVENTEKLNDLFLMIEKILPENKVEKTKIIINDLIKEQKNTKSVFLTILYIYIRIGYEAGKIKRCLQDAHISWGCFVDHNPASFHLNAHGNNFIVLPQGYNSLLAPIDFDLAYTKEKSVNIFKDSNTFGQHDESYYENYINSERNDLSRDLCGAEDYGFSHPKGQNSEEKKLEEKLSDCIKYLFSDCLLENYMKSFDNIFSKNVISSDDLKNNNFLHNIIKLALILTSDEIA